MRLTGRRNMPQAVEDEKRKKQIDWKKIVSIVSILISLGILFYFCISKNGLLALLGQIYRFKAVWVVLAVSCMFGDLFLDACLIYLFTKDTNPGYRFRFALKVCLAGHFYSAITPFQSGGQPMQIYLMSRQRIDPGKATSALVQKFFVYQTGIAFYSLLAILLQTFFFRKPLSPAMWGLTSLGFAVQLAVAVFLLLISFNRKLTHKLLEWAGRLPVVKKHAAALPAWEKQIEFFHRSNRQIYRNPRLLAGTYVLTFLQLTALFLVPYCIFRAFDIGRASVLRMLCYQAFVTMVSSLFPLPGSAGAAETSFYSFFSSFFTPETIKSADLLWRVISYYLVLLVCAPFSKIGKKLEAERG